MILKSKYISIGLLAILTLLLYTKELTLLIYPHHFVQVIDYIPDEILFYRGAMHYSLNSGMLFAYGYIFWAISHAIIKISPFGFDVNIVLLRAIFLATKYAAFALTALSVARLKDRFAGAVVYLTLLITPGFYFYGKVFSPEYMLLFLIALTLFAVAYDYFYLAIVTAITASFLKIYAAPILLLVAYQAFKKPSKIKMGAIVGLATVSLNALPLFTSKGLHQTLYWFHKNVGSFSLTWVNLHEWFFLKIRTWDQIPLGGVLVDFTPLFIVGIALILCGISHYKNYKPQWLGWITLLAGLIIGGVILSYTGKLYWYLFTPYILILAGLFLTTYNVQYKILILAALVTAFIFSYPRISWRIADRAKHNEILRENEQINKQINAYLYKYYPSGGVILTDILVGDTINQPFKIIYLRQVADGKHLHRNEIEFLIVNRQIKNSPLEDLIFNGKIPPNFILIKNFDGLELMKKAN